MNKITHEQKLSCMLFGCPMVEELKSCSMSNLRILTSSQPFFVEEKEEKILSDYLISAKYLCIKNK
jgi:hypothetical protein